MQKAKFVSSLSVLCPACRSTMYLTYRREPARQSGHVMNRCSCKRCGVHFRFEEDRLGRPVVD